MKINKFEKEIQKIYGKGWKARYFEKKKNENVEVCAFYKVFQDGIIYFQVNEDDLKSPYAVGIRIGVFEDGPIQEDYEKTFNFLKNI